MLYAIQPAPFLEADRQRQYEAVRAALAAEANAPPTVLLGNLEELAGLAADALLLRANCLVLLVLSPGAGHLTLPVEPLGPWQLDGQPLPARAGAPNPLAHYRAQLPAVQAWAAEQLGQPVAALVPTLGLAVFDAPLTFGPEVERRLHQATADDFELLGGAERLPTWLRTLTASDFIAEDELIDWATYLLAPSSAAGPTTTEDATPAAYLLRKLQQLWQWLGAADVPPDPPYGSAPDPALARRDQQEQARLHQLRQELQAELRQQRQEAAARETAYQQELLRLQQQVLHAGPAAEAQQAKAAEAARQAAQAELATRTQELDRRIQQLGQLIQQLQVAPAPVAEPSRPAMAASARPAVAVPPVRVAPSPTSAAPTRTKRPSAAMQPALWQQLRPAERGALLGVALVGLVVGIWKMEQRNAPAPKHARTVAARQRTTIQLPGDGATPPPVYVVDSSLASEASHLAPITADDNGSAEEPTEPELHVQRASLQVDSGQVEAEPAPIPADSSQLGDSPTP